MRWSRSRHVGQDAACEQPNYTRSQRRPNTEPAAFVHEYPRCESYNKIRVTEVPCHPERVISRLALLCLALCVPARAIAAPAGQWVWSRADVDVLARARDVRADLEAAVQVAELRFLDGEVHSALRLPPAIVPRAGSVVIRLHDSFHVAWSGPPEVVERALADALGRVLALVRSTAPQTRVLQLDYDCPTRFLPRWAALLAALRARGLFDGYELWITSLVAQLRDERFGRLFRPLVSGHIVQVFDTGELASEAARAELSSLLTRADLPFRVGLGAFERARGGAQRTEHVAWWQLTAALAAHPRFRGTWVFAAGQNWADSLRGLP